MRLYPVSLCFCMYPFHYVSVTGDELRDGPGGQSAAGSGCRAQAWPREGPGSLGVGIDSLVSSLVLELQVTFPVSLPCLVVWFCAVLRVLVCCQVSTV